MVGVSLTGGLGLTACSAPPEATGMRLPDHFRSAGSIGAHGMITQTLHAWHRAAARGRFDAYFGRMTEDAAFLGTDRTEWWTRDEFEAFSRPHFDGVHAWTYEQIETNIAFPPPVPGVADEPRAAWVDEVLWNEKYGYCRGTGLLTREGEGPWLIHRYSLSLLVPNEKSAEVMDAIGPQPAPGKPSAD